MVSVIDAAKRAFVSLLRSLAAIYGVAYPGNLQANASTSAPEKKAAARHSANLPAHASARENKLLRGIPATLWLTRAPPRQKGFTPLRGFP